jgi:hypothetical protein
MNTKARSELENERSVTPKKQVTSKEQPELLSKEHHATSKEGLEPEGKEGFK